MTEDSRILLSHVMERLEKWNRQGDLYPENPSDSRGASAVLFLLKECPQGIGLGAEPCIVFNKRSKQVRQSGDLCFPGGRIVHYTDSMVAKLLGFPFLPLGRWPYWKEWKTIRRKESAHLALLLATGLRESLEEMRLNPFGAKFLGPMPPQILQPFQKVLYPMVVWIRDQKHFILNREVEKIVSIPVKDFLKPEKYVCYRMHFESAQIGNVEATQDFPGFLHEIGENREVLWGVTYRIVITFLEMAFSFSPPEMDSLAVVDGCRGKDYFESGSKV